MTSAEEFDRIVYTDYRADSEPRVWPLDRIEIPHAQS